MVQCTRLGFNRDRGIYLEPSGSPAARLAWDRTRGGGGALLGLGPPECGCVWARDAVKY